MSAKNALKMVAIGSIRENPVALREVNKTDENYTGLVDSIKDVGVLNPINVREMTDPETGQKYYSLIDGLHRWNAAQDAGLDEMPVQVITADDAQVLELQLMANIHKVETRPVEYSKQLNRILANNPLMLVTELAAKLSMSTTWISQRLGLVKLDKRVAELVDGGQINLANAYVMAKLPPEEQLTFIDRAITMQPAEFTPTVNARVKELRDAKRQGREAGPTEFVPVPHLRKLSEIKGEADNVSQVLQLVREQGLKTEKEIIAATLEWALHLDPSSVAAAKAKAEARDAEESAKKDARKKEREEKKAAAAAAAQAAAVAGGVTVEA